MSGSKTSLCALCKSHVYETWYFCVDGFWYGFAQRSSGCKYCNLNLVCVCVCVCCTVLCVCYTDMVYMHIPKCIHTYISGPNSFLQACVCVCVYIHTYTHTYVCINMYQGRTPFLNACEGGNLDDVKLLLAARADIYQTIEVCVYVCMWHVWVYDMYKSMCVCIYIYII